MLCSLSRCAEYLHCILRRSFRALYNQINIAFVHKYLRQVLIADSAFHDFAKKLLDVVMRPLEPHLPIPGFVSQYRKQRDRIKGIADIDCRSVSFHLRGFRNVFQRFFCHVIGLGFFPLWHKRIFVPGSPITFPCFQIRFPLSLCFRDFPQAPFSALKSAQE